MSSRAAVAIVLGGTLGFAFKAILARFAYASGVNVTGLLWLRAAIATPLLWLAGVWMHRHFRGVRARDLVKACACGVMFLASASLDFLAVHGLGAGPSRVILFAYPLIVIVLKAVRDRRSPPREALWAFGVAWLGLLVVSSDSWRRGAEPIAVLYGLGAATVHAIFLTLTQSLARRMGSVPFTVCSNTGTALGIFTYVGLLAPTDAVEYTPEGVGWLTLLAVFCTALPMLLMVEGVRQLGASRASILSLVGPVLTLAGAYLLLGEALTELKLLGAVLVIGAVGWHTLSRASVGELGEGR